MSETRKSLTIAGIAVVAAVLAYATAPRSVTPDAFLDRGELFFPDFDNPNEAATLEVIEFDEETASAIPFKVTNSDGKWTIPSHHDYPADGEDRLAETAAGVIGITKDDFRTDNVSDHEACGVIDPLDEGATSLKGRGKRVTLRGENDQVLADFIIGKDVEGRENHRFVRVPGQKRVYLAKIEIDISTGFQDWIEKDLLGVERDEIDQVVLEDYSIDEVTRRVDQRDLVTLEKKDDTWSADRMRSGQEVDSFKMDDLLNALDDLEIVGVRPKPEGLTASLTRVDQGFSITQEDMISLQSRGYYFSRDGALLSNEGEIRARTSEGVGYNLRFGEVLYGSGEAVTAGTGESDDQSAGPGENRYLFITATFDDTILPEPARPADTTFQEKPEEEWTDGDRANKSLFDAHQEWEKKIEDGGKKVNALNARFAGWYYVISDANFKKMRLTRSDLVVEKEEE